jgi:hypothetical protein
MGWLYMQSLKGYSGPRQYLDAQFTFVRPELTSRVLRSALVGMRVYYAAIEHARHETNERMVFAAVCSSATTRVTARATFSATKTWTKPWARTNQTAPRRSSICSRRPNILTPRRGAPAAGRMQRHGARCRANLRRVPDRPSCSIRLCRSEMDAASIVLKWWLTRAAIAQCCSALWIPVGFTGSGTSRS